MPACITHNLFAKEVGRLCRKQGIPTHDPAMMALGSQGPDVFFFHRAFPWQRGERGFKAGIAMHHASPAKLLSVLYHRAVAETVDPDLMRGYVNGFLCHYVLDRMAHPFVLYWQEELQKQRPQYGHTPSQYHFCIESALDTRTLRRQMGRLISDYDLTSLVPVDDGRRYDAFARLYLPVFGQVLGQWDVTPERLKQAPGDMWEAMFWMTDRYGSRQAILRAGERLFSTGAIATSLLRPLRIDDWDYANESHASWHPPTRPEETTTASFDDLWDAAAKDAVAMIDGFWQTDGSETAMAELTGNIDFSGNACERSQCEHD